MNEDDKEFLKMWGKSMGIAFLVSMPLCFLVGWGLCAALGVPYW